MILSNIKNNMTCKENFSKTIIFSLIILVFIISSFTFLIKRKGTRYTFVFPSANNGKYIIEARRLTKQKNKDNVNIYADEILLGSTLERTKLLFTSGTKLISCFQRGKVLYLNLSAKSLQMGEGVIELKEGVELLKKNIKRNFKDIDVVEVFINGKLAFEK
ncbi:hypothetical protein [Treponema sp. Marseille-Q3903]|uniref:hypothetical protein n=1 Tax=Treponema sp. Marseille-Q3903 TaxID=2766703 RepID=UPI0016525D79|nr:hypothetical protein [Treponema sp. Marseille-Q3903]MBC6713462.1 hypothetical protein [Treponema sp. Marseille-Q3903]